MKSSCLWLWVAGSVLLWGASCTESNSRSSGNQITPATQKEDSSPTLEGAFYCRVRNLPNKWPEYVFRCSIKKESQQFTLRALEEAETRLSIKPTSKSAVQLSGVVFMKERTVGKQYPQRWVVVQESPARVSEVSGKPYLEGTFRAVLQFESQRKKGNRTDFRTGTSTPIGQEATVEFVVSQ